MLRIVATGIIFHLLSPDLATACWWRKTNNNPLSIAGLLGPKTSDEFKQAITDSRSGDVILLLPIVYEGDFQLVGSKNVTIKGTNKNGNSTTIISTGTAFNILGSNWGIQSLVIQALSVGVNINGHDNTLLSISMPSVRKGVLISGDGNLVKGSSIKCNEIGLNVTGNKNLVDSNSISKSSSSSGINIIGNQNVVSANSISCNRNRVTESLISIRTTGVNVNGNENTLSGNAVSCVVDGLIINGHNNLVKSSSIQSETIGINVIKGNGNKIESSSITQSNPSLIIANGTSDGSIISNSFKGAVDIFGNGYTITSNSASGGTNIQGCNNILSKNSMRNGVVNSCNQFDNSNYFG